MKQTAIEWLVEKINQNHGYIGKTMIEEAEKIFHQEISNAYQTGIIDGLNHQPRDYYNETFKE